MKTFLTLLFVVLFIFNTNAQPVIEWQKSLGGTSQDRAYDIRQTNDDGYIVVGFSNSSNGDVSGCYPNADFWVVKIDQLGSLQWQKCLGGSSAERAYDVQQTTDGGYIIVGYTSSTNNDVSGNHGSSDFWVVKLDALGNIEWQKCLGGSSDEIAFSVNRTSDDGYILAGYSMSTDGDASGNYGNEDYWVVKLDVNGIMEWQKSFGGNTTDIAYCIQQTSDGGYIVSGESWSDTDDVSINYGGSDYWVVKIDAFGNIQWENSFGGPGSDIASSVQEIVGSGYLVGGYSSSNSGDISGNHGIYDYWLIKLDISGNIQWQKSLGGTANDQNATAVLTVDGGCVIVGDSFSNNNDVTGNNGGNDYWVVKLDEFGNIQWQKCLGGSSNDAGTSIQQTSDGGFVVAGYSRSTDGDVTGNHGGYDYWVVKLGMDPILPIELISFTAENKEGVVEFNWVSGSETNNDYFFVERSADGLGWVTVVSVPGQGSSQSTNNYQAYDHHAPEGLSYYRLTQVDYDGQREVFNRVLAVYVDKKRKTIYPNPAKVGQVVKIPIGVRVTDVVGRKTSYSNQQFIPTKSGIYFVGKEKLIVVGN